MVNVGRATAAGHAWKWLSDYHHTSEGCFTRVLCLSGSYPQISCPWHPRSHCGRWGKHSLTSALEATSPAQKTPKSWSPQTDGFKSHVRMRQTQKQSFPSYLCRPKAAVTLKLFCYIGVGVFSQRWILQHMNVCVFRLTSAKWLKHHKKFSFCKTSPL